MVIVPVPWMMKRIAAAVWRWDGAISPGSTICTAPVIVCVAPPRVAGLFSVSTRRCALGPGVTSSIARRVNGSIVVQLQWRGGYVPRGGPSSWCRRQSASNSFFAISS